MTEVLIHMLLAIQITALALSTISMTTAVLTAMQTNPSETDKKLIKSSIKVSLAGILIFPIAIYLACSIVTNTAENLYKSAFE